MLPGEPSFYDTKQKQANKAPKQGFVSLPRVPLKSASLPGHVHTARLKKRTFLQLELARDGMAKTTMWSLLCSEPDPAEAG